MLRTFAGQVLMVVALLGPLHGCEAGNSERPEPHETVPPSIDKQLSAIPGNAKIVASTPGELTFRAPADGMVYLYDVSDKMMIDVQRIARGDSYEVIRDRSMVRVNERFVPVTQLRPLDDGREYRVYFSPTPKDSAD